MKISIVVQAGGESRRMGQNKALLPFLGRPLIERVLQRVAPFADELLITGNRPEELAFLGLPVVADLEPGRGALGGLYTALSAARFPWVGVVACDMPFASSALLAAEWELAAAAGVDGAVPWLEAGYEPFHAVYRKDTCQAVVKAALEAGEERLISWFPAARLIFLTSEEVRRCDPSGLAFFNINTPEEYQQALKLANPNQ